MVARQQIEAGKLIEGGYKVLALPFVQSLSVEEIEQIKKFVENGGMLIADYRTGIRDKHGKVFTKSPLDELFGIERSSYELEKQYTQVVVDDLYAGHSYGQVKTLFHNANVKVVSDKAVVIGTHESGAPLFISNKYGKGNTMYLNADIYDFQENISIITSNGRINLYINPSLNADIEIETSNGQIVTSGIILSLITNEEKHKVGTLGDGGNKITIKTSNGNINIYELEI